MNTVRDKRLFYIMLAYFTYKCIYWNMWKDGVNWDIFYHVFEKGLPIALVLKDWDKITFKPLGYTIIGMLVFLAVYSVLCRYVEGFTDYRDISVTLTFFFYCVSIFFITFTRKK